MADVDVGVAAPVVPASTDAPALGTTADQVVSPAGGEKPIAPQRPRFDDEQQKEVDRIVGKRVAQESRRLERAARAEAEAAHYKRLLEQQQQPQGQASKTGEPQQKDFTDYEKYVIAKAKYEFKQEQAAEREASQRTTTTQQQQREEAEIARHVQDNVYAKGVAKYDDFDDVAMGEGVAISKPMAAFIADSPIGSDIWYALGRDAAESRRINDLSPAGQFRALVAMEAKLKAPPKPTNTPAPIVPNGSASAGNKKDWKEMSTEEHIKAYRAQKKRS